MEAVGSSIEGLRSRIFDTETAVDKKRHAVLSVKNCTPRLSCLWKHQVCQLRSFGDFDFAES